jgi:hypothetical protein
MIGSVLFQKQSLKSQPNIMAVWWFNNAEVQNAKDRARPGGVGRRDLD